MLFQVVVSPSLLYGEPDAQHMLAPSSMSVVWFVCRCPMFFEGADAQHMLGPSSMSVVWFVCRGTVQISDTHFAIR